MQRFLLMQHSEEPFIHQFWDANASPSNLRVIALQSLVKVAVCTVRESSDSTDANGLLIEIIFIHERWGITGENAVKKHKLA